jgi:hypothetical protein
MRIAALFAFLVASSLAGAEALQRADRSETKRGILENSGIIWKAGIPPFTTRPIASIRDDSLDTHDTMDALKDGRTLTMGSEPDIAVYKDGKIQVAIEIKGGIDTAGALEWFGAALKSLNRAKQENPESVTVLVVHEAFNRHGQR